MPSSQPWLVHDRFLELRSRWFSLIGEHLEDDTGQKLDYWRIEKADSVIVLPIWCDRILLPPPTYRPGLGKVTLDLPGGRVLDSQTPAKSALASLERELGISAMEVSQLSPLNVHGWAINSSFSNQRLYGFVANIRAEASLQPIQAAKTHRADSKGVHSLLESVTCLQCRAVLLEWWLQQST